jgi:hypothetical protein
VALERNVNRFLGTNAVDVDSIELLRLSIVLVSGEEENRTYLLVVLLIISRELGHMRKE